MILELLRAGAALASLEALALGLGVEHRIPSQLSGLLSQGQPA